MYNITPPKKLRREVKNSTMRKKICDHIIFCLSIASMHGLIHIIRIGRHPLEKFVWFCLVLGASIVAIFQALKVWHHYQTRPVMISLERDYFNWNSTFPGVTICHRMKSNKYYKFLKLWEKEFGFHENDPNLEEYLEDLLFTNYYTYHTLEKYANGSRKEFFPANYYVKLISGIINVVQMDSNKSNPRAQKTTHPLGVRQPFHYVLTEHGLCSVYNSEISIYFAAENFNSTNATNEIRPTHFGYKSGIVTFMSKSLYSGYDTFFHSPNEIIDITSRNMSASWLSLQEIALRIMSVLSAEGLESLSIEQRKCRFINEVGNLKYSPVYSYNLCRIECRIELCLKYCKCTPYYYRRLHGEPICNLTGLYCLSKYSEEIITLIKPNTNKTLCPCLQTCDFDNIIVTEVHVQDKFLDTNIRISVRDFPEVRYKRTLIFTKADVLVQIGGLFGLFLGCSILSLMEIPYFVTLRFFFAIFGNKSIKADL